MSPSSKNKASGFSIVELIGVLLIIAVLAAFAIPITQSQLRLHRLDVTTSLVGGKLMEARMDAIKRNRTSRLLISTAGTAQVRTTDTGGNAIDVGEPEVFPPDVVLVSGSDIEILFDSMGRTTSAQSVTFSDTQTDYQKTLSVSVAGKITVGSMTPP